MLLQRCGDIHPNPGPKFSVGERPAFSTAEASAFGGESRGPQQGLPGASAPTCSGVGTGWCLLGGTLKEDGDNFQALIPLTDRVVPVASDYSRTSTVSRSRTQPHRIFVDGDRLWSECKPTMHEDPCAERVAIDTTTTTTTTTRETTTTTTATTFDNDSVSTRDRTTCACRSSIGASRPGANDESVFSADREDGIANDGDNDVSPRNSTRSESPAPRDPTGVCDDESAANIPSRDEQQLQVLKKYRNRLFDEMEVNVLGAKSDEERRDLLAKFFETINDRRSTAAPARIERADDEEPLVRREDVLITHLHDLFTMNDSSSMRQQLTSRKRYHQLHPNQKTAEEEQQLQLQREIQQLLSNPWARAPRKDARDVAWITTIIATTSAIWLMCTALRAMSFATVSVLAFLYIEHEQLFLDALRSIWTAARHTAMTLPGRGRAAALRLHSGYGSMRTWLRATTTRAGEIASATFVMVRMTIEASTRPKITERRHDEQQQHETPLHGALAACTACPEATQPTAISRDVDDEDPGLEATTEAGQTVTIATEKVMTTCSESQDTTTDDESTAPPTTSAEQTPTALAQVAELHTRDSDDDDNFDAVLLAYSPERLAALTGEATPLTTAAGHCAQAPPTNNLDTVRIIEEHTGDSARDEDGRDADNAEQATAATHVATTTTAAADDTSGDSSQRQQASAQTTASTAQTTASAAPGTSATEQESQQQRRIQRGDDDEPERRPQRAPSTTPATKTASDKKKCTLNIATLNVRHNSDLGLIVAAAQRHNLDVLACTETAFTSDINMRFEDTGYTVIAPQAAESTADRGSLGTAFVIRHDKLRIRGLVRSETARVSTLCCTLGKQKLAFVAAYAPQATQNKAAKCDVGAPDGDDDESDDDEDEDATEDNPTTTRDVPTSTTATKATAPATAGAAKKKSLLEKQREFWTALATAYDSITTGRVYVLGDFNAQFPNQCCRKPANSNGTALLNFAQARDLLILNSDDDESCRLPRRRKYTLRSTLTRGRRMLDLILCRRGYDRNDVRYVRPVAAHLASADHRMVRALLDVQHGRLPRKAQAGEGDARTTAAVNAAWHKRDMDSEVERLYAHYHDKVEATQAKVEEKEKLQMGDPAKARRPARSPAWFTPELWQKASRVNEMWHNLQQQRNGARRRAAKTRLREERKAYWKAKRQRHNDYVRAEAELLEQYYAAGNMSAASRIVKKYTRKQITQLPPHEAAFERYVEHFRDVMHGTRLDKPRQSSAPTQPTIGDTVATERTTETTTANTTRGVAHTTNPQRPAPPTPTQATVAERAATATAASATTVTAEHRRDDDATTAARLWTRKVAFTSSLPTERDCLKVGRQLHDEMVRYLLFWKCGDAMRRGGYEYCPFGTFVWHGQRAEQFCDLGFPDDWSKVIIPLHYAAHFALAIADKAANTVTFYDSYVNYCPEIRTALLEKIRETLRLQRVVAGAHDAQQPGSNDCGIHVIRHAQQVLGDRTAKLTRPLAQRHVRTVATAERERRRELERAEDRRVAGHIAQAAAAGASGEWIRSVINSIPASKRLDSDEVERIISRTQRQGDTATTTQQSTTQTAAIEVVEESTGAQHQQRTQHTYPHPSPNATRYALAAPPRAATREERAGRKEITVATDGGATSNGDRVNGRASYGVHFPNKEYGDAKGRAPGLQTNNRGEIFALVKALRITQRDLPDIRLVTDSQVVISGIRNTRRWVENNFADIDHGDLWREVAKHQLQMNRRITAVKVKSHTTHDGKNADLVANDTADDLATEGLLAAAQPREAPDASPVQHQDFDDDIPTADEINEALGHLHDTSPGLDGMRAKAMKTADEATQAALVELIQACWRTRTVPAAFREAVIVALPKKHNAKELNDHRGITLLSVAGKVLCRVILDRGRNAPVLPVQHGFRRANGTAAATLITKRVMEEANKVGLPAVFTFIDLTKAYDSVPRELIWETMRLYGYGPTAIALMQAMYEDENWVKICGQMSEGSFRSGRGLRQGDLLSPFLFNLVMDRILRTAMPQMRGIPIGNDAETRLMKARAYADDVVLFSRNIADAQRDLDAFNCACEVAGLTINAKKTQYIRLPDKRSAIERPKLPHPLPEGMGVVPEGYSNSGAVYCVMPQREHDDNDDNDDEDDDNNDNATTRAKRRAKPDARPRPTRILKRGEIAAPTKAAAATKKKDTSSTSTNTTTVDTAGRTQEAGRTIPKCPICGTCVSSRSTLWRHLGFKHGLRVAVLEKPPTRKRDVHIVQLDDGRWKCGYCDHAYDIKHQAATHERAKHADKPATWTMYATSKPLENHKADRQVEADRRAELGMDFPREANDDAATLTLGGKAIERVKQFRYLGTFLAENGSLRPAVGARILAAECTFKSLHRTLFRGNTMRMTTRLKVYDAMIAPQLLFGAECWTTLAADDDRLDRVQQRFFRHLTRMNPKWDSSRGHIMYPPCHEVYRQACRPKASDVVTFAQTRFYGHILRRGDDDDARFLVAPETSRRTCTTDERVEPVSAVAGVAVTGETTTISDDNDDETMKETTTTTTTTTVSVQGLRSIRARMRRRSIDVRMKMQAEAAGLKPEYAESRTDWRNSNVAWRERRRDAAGHAPVIGERAQARAATVTS